MKILVIILAIILAISAYSLPVMAAQNATIILTFDDGWNSVLQNAKPIMDANGQKGVEFIITGQPELSWNGQPNNYMNVVQLQQLYDAGWDLSSHTVSHVVLTTVNSTVLNSELSGSKDWLDMHGFTRGSMFLAYPEGVYNSNVVGAVQANHYVGARTVELPNGTYNHYTLTSPDIYNMKDRESVGGIDNDITIIKEIDNAVAVNGLLILSFHKIVDTMSTNVTDMRTEFLTSDFANVSNHLKNLSDNGNVTVMTLSEYLGAMPLPRYVPEAPGNVAGELYESLAISFLNVSWSPGIGNATDLYNIYLNGTAITGNGNSINLTVFPEEQINLSIYPVNTTNGNTIGMPAFYNTTIPVLKTYMPSTPVNLTSTNGDVINGAGNILVHWNPGLGLITDFYNVSVNKLNANGSVLSSLSSNMSKNTSYTLNGVPGTIYSFRIYAINVTNGTTMNQTPGIINVWIPLYTPPIPSEVRQSYGNFWTYFEWSNGTGNVTDFYNYSINGVWTNLSTNKSVNVSTIPRGTVNVSVYAYNMTNGGIQNPIPLFMYITLPSNQIELSNIWAEYDIFAGDTFRINPIVYNPDNDTIRFTTNATLNATIDNRTGAFVLNTTNGEQGIYYWNITAYDDKAPSNHTINFKVVITTKPTIGGGKGGGNNGGASGGNNGGGGGSAASVYDPNAESYERRDSQIRHDVDSSVEFFKNNIVKNVTFHGIRNYGEVTVKVAILKGNPKPSYLNNTYKFFSIALDAIQQQNEYLYINKSIVTVFVNKRNISDGGMEKIVKAYRYIENSNSWKPVEIEDIGTNNDGSSEEFKLTSDGLSNFVLVLEPIPMSMANVQVSLAANNSLTGNPSIDKVIKKVIPESWYRRIINFIRRYMWWI